MSARVSHPAVASTSVCWWLCWARLAQVTGGQAQLCHLFTACWATCSRRQRAVLHFWHCLSCLVSRCLVKNQKYGYLSCTLLWVKLSKPLLDFFFIIFFLPEFNVCCFLFCFFSWRLFQASTAVQFYQHCNFAYCHPSLYFIAGFIVTTYSRNIVDHF